MTPLAPPPPLEAPPPPPPPALTRRKKSRKHQRCHQRSFRNGVAATPLVRQLDQSNLSPHLQHLPPNITTANHGPVQPGISANTLAPQPCPPPDLHWPSPWAPRPTEEAPPGGEPGDRSPWKSQQHSKRRRGRTIGGGVMPRPGGSTTAPSRPPTDTPTAPPKHGWQPIA